MRVNTTEDHDSEPASFSDESWLTAYNREIAHTTRLVPDDEKDLSRRIKDGDKDALNQLVQANLYLVVTLAMRLRHMRYGVPVPDLIQDGNLGLMRAAEDFDGERGVLFSTYATWWIRQFIMRGPYSGHSAMAPSPAMRKAISRMRKFVRNFTQDNDREPSDEEIAAGIGITIETVWGLKRVVQPVVSLDAPVHEVSKKTLADRLAAPEAPKVAMFARDSLREYLLNVGVSLTKREMAVLTLRFGFGDGQALSIREIAGRLECSGSTVRKVEARLLMKLRIPRVSRLLVDALA